MKNESSVGIRETRREMSHVLSCLIMAKQLKVSPLVLSVNQWGGLWVPPRTARDSGQRNICHQLPSFKVQTS